MNVSISGHHISITEAMETSVREKMAKIERHFDQIQSIQVILSLDNSGSGKKSHKAEAILRVSGNEMFVQSYDDDMYKAIHDMADKLDRQVRKYKTRLQDKKTQGAGRDGRYAEGEPVVEDVEPTA